MNRMRITLSTLTALALAMSLGTAGTAEAQNGWNVRGDELFRSGTGAHSVADGNIVDVQIRTSGDTAPLFFRPGTNDRHYFQAFKGRNYSVVIRNTTGRRVGVLLAVDGINVVNGDRSSLSRNEPMYVLDPWESAEISGWRTSLNEVRRFVFVDEQRSYAERTGQSNGDLGWIRVLAFREAGSNAWWQGGRPDVNDGREAVPFSGKAMPRNQAAPQLKPMSPGDRSMAEGFGDEGDNPGTGWGDRNYDPVQRTRFEGERVATDHIVFRYEYASGLRALGIVPRRARTFEREDGQFAQYPRW